jgi:hypothetical protein
MTEQETINELSEGLNETLDRCEALEAELAEAKTRLAAFEAAFAEGGTLGVLQRLAHDPALKTKLRIRAASAAVAFERPKLAMTAAVQPVKLFDILEARRNAGKVIEQAPAPLDLDGPTPPTILGHDGGPDPAA